MKKLDYIFSVGIILGFLLPHSSVFTLVVNPILWMLLFFVSQRATCKTCVLLPAIIGLIVATTANLLDPSMLEFKVWGRVGILLIYLSLFPCIGNVKISQSVLYFVLLTIVGSQLAFAYNIGTLTGVIDTIWPYEGDMLGYQTDFLARRVDNSESVLGNFRWGGLYRNPNQCIRYVSLILVVFLLETREVSFRKRIPFLLLVGLSVLLSGSRTGFLVCVVLILCDLVFLRKKVWAKWSAVAIVACGMGILLVAPVLKESYRIFNIGEGFEGSLGTKIYWFYSYLKTMSPWEFLFGSVSPTYLSMNSDVPMLDSEWGYYFFLYGLIASMGLIISIIWLWRESRINTHFFMIISLWGITSSILLSNRMSFIYLLFLSVYFCRDKFQETTNIINNGNQIIRFNAR